MLVRGVALAAALALPAAAHASGSSSVAALQVALHARKVYAGPVDGVAGRATTAAVVRLQQRAGLAPDGVVGPQTARVLGPLGGPALGARVLRRGAVGGDVSALQFELAARGAPSGVFDGRFGDRLEAAVKRFQTAAGLPADGIAGSATLAALREPPAPVPVVLHAPVAAPVADGFGPRGRAFHAGLDFALPAGAAVAAAAPGRVVFAGWRRGGFGLTVLVAHGGGVRTLYGHLSSVAVAVGDRVAAGELLGLVGASGRATGPHLHFELRLRGLARDPSPLLRW